MSDFFTETKIEKTRKRRYCRHCDTLIQTNNPAIRCAGSWGGDFGVYYCHPECLKAGDAYAKITGYWGEEYIFFCDGDFEDWSWLIEQHGQVAGRMMVCW